MGAMHVLAPVFVQVALTFSLLMWMGKLRVEAVRGGVVRTSDIALGQPNWSPQIAQFNNAYRSQLELPVLFYLVSMLSLFTARASLTLVILAWFFVATRLLHTLVHVTTNNVVRRFFLFLAGTAVLILMWVVYGFDLYFGGAPSLVPLDIDALGGGIVQGDG
jgi:hypothetical protein